jgi:Protein of unknown function (DUF2742).
VTNLYLDRDTHIDPFLGIGSSDTTKDTLLNILNTQSAALLDSIFNVTTLAKHTVTDERVEDAGTDLYVRDFPVLSVTSITQGSANTPYTQTASYILEKNRIRLDWCVEGGKGYEATKVTYEAGYVTFAQNADTEGDYHNDAITFPDDLQLANLLLLAGLFNQKQNIGVSSYTINGKSITFRDDVEAGEFERIINLYKKVRVIGI